MLTTSAILQAAAIPLRDQHLCLVQSSSGRGWTIPKGSVEAEQTLEQTALREAWEEAGILGVLSPRPVGTYIYDKLGGTRKVHVFLMEVTEVAERWPECYRRLRIWAPIPEALPRLHEPNLLRLLRSVLSPEHYSFTG